MTETEKQKFAITALRKEVEALKNRVKRLELVGGQTGKIENKRTPYKNPMFWFLRKTIDQYFELDYQNPTPRKKVFEFLDMMARMENGLPELSTVTLGKVLKDMYGDKVKCQRNINGVNISFYNLRSKLD